jgi:hypothetical protein
MYKTLLFVLTLVLAQFNAFSQKESGKMPSWVNGVEKGYLIVSASSSTIQQAKDKAFSKIRENVILSVAVQVNYSSTSTVSEKVQNNTRELNEEFVAKVNLHSGQLGFVNGISESKIADFYWVKTSKKKEPDTYVYYIKYPFSDSDLNTLISEYNREVNKRKQELEVLKRELLLTSTADSLKIMHQKVKFFRSQTGFYDDQVLGQMETEITDFTKASKFEIQKNQLGFFELNMSRNGRPFLVSIDNISSDIKGLRYEKNDRGYACYYDYANMNYTDKCVFEISYSLLGKTQKRTLSLDLQSVYPRFNLSKLYTKADVEGIYATMYLNVLNEVGFEVESLEIVIKSNSFTFKNAHPGLGLKRGENELILVSSGEAQKFFALLESSYNLADVFIRYQIPQTQFKQSLNLYQQKIQL